MDAKIKSLILSGQPQNIILAYCISKSVNGWFFRLLDMFFKKFPFDALNDSNFLKSDIRKFVKNRLYFQLFGLKFGRSSKTAYRYHWASCNWVVKPTPEVVLFHVRKFLRT